MGAQGFGIYYAVGFALPVSIDVLEGDSFWPSVILAGMAWAPAFLFRRMGVRWLRTSSKLAVVGRVYFHPMGIGLSPLVGNHCLQNRSVKPLHLDSPSIGLAKPNQELEPRFLST